MGFEGELFGSSSTWEEDTDGVGEVWMDFAPVEYAPWYAGGDGDGGGTGDDGTGDGTGDGTEDGENAGNTPGFESIAVIAALGVAFIIYRRRK